MGSEMCIRDRFEAFHAQGRERIEKFHARGRRATEEYLVEKRRSGELKPRSLRLVLETIYAQQIYYHEVTTGTQIRIVIF